MKKILIPVIALFFVIDLYSQNNARGIFFEEQKSWEEILIKAKNENKYIFVDCFATWCLPCKLMDKEVYTSDSVGDFINENYISIKVQMDTLKDDKQSVKQWYSDANYFRQIGRIGSYPTYLFFSPEGQLVHKAVGLINIDDFIKLAQDAQNPRRQYYTLASKFHRESIDYPEMRYLASIAEQFGEQDFAYEVAKQYLGNYLWKLNKDQLFKQENIMFMRSFLRSSRDDAFDFFYNNAGAIDSIMEMDYYSQSILDYVISKEFIDSNIFPSKKREPIHPDWPGMWRSIANTYDTNFAHRNIINAQLRWFKFKKQWKLYSKKLIEKVNKYGPTGIGILDFDLNNHAWDIFEHSTDPDDLRIALLWSDSAIQINRSPNWLDTKANILYKLRRREEAINLQLVAVELAKTSGEKELYQQLQKALNQMKSGLPTWNVE